MIITLKKILPIIYLVGCVFCQGNWETAVYANDDWSYLIPLSELPIEWKNLDFDDSNWLIGTGGFGYGDEDDGTEISPTISVFLRRKFIVDNVYNLKNAILHADYDDGFIAYLNGVEIGRSTNLGEIGTFVSYDQNTSTDHEALLYSGNYPEEYHLDSTDLASILSMGENLLSVQVHNINNSSSDLSSNFFLSFSVSDDTTYYGIPPGWFQEPFVFSESNLPIVVLDTEGQEIIDLNRITANMGIIDINNGINQIGDSYNGYNGKISIEIRGSSSQMFPKKQYSLETQDIDGENLNVSILGMPEENDWVLFAPYSDKSLIRNFLAYELSRLMGQYASRTRFCELVINNDYKGIYIFMEKIKRDDNRVDISKLNTDDEIGDELTGGYILKVDKWSGNDNNGWFSESPIAEYDGVWYQYHYPKPDMINEQQMEYITNYISDFEGVMADSNYNDIESGYYDKVNLESFIHVSIISELSKNVDAYRLSSYMYKDKNSEDSLLNVGPIWDYNLAFGNADYYGGWNPEGWQMEIELDNDNFKIPFWWYRIWDDHIFKNGFNQRWEELRQSIFSEEYIMNIIDSTTSVIHHAQIRNFQRWPILDEYVWPNAHFGGSYEDEISYLKGWIIDRLEWIDQQILSVIPFSKLPIMYSLDNVYPNPFNPNTTIRFYIPRNDLVQIKVFDIRGNEVTTLVNKELRSGNHRVTWNGKNLGNGIYFVQMISGENNYFVQTNSMILLK